MNHKWVGLLVVFNMSLATSALASDKSVALAQAHCINNKCDNKSAVKYAISAAQEGTCLLFSSNSNLKVFSFAKKPNKDWWIVTKSQLKEHQYQSTIAFAKVFAEASTKQVYLAEPVKNLEQALVDYCLATYHNFKFKHENAIGFLVPKK
ncbi:hypothetical protein [Pseudoalteromonas sp. Ld20]|uniref:hypothetical protein n=1 Tax=Pseudoalteromonas sp. Ld20 TaxID=649165 RepID=UPI00386E55EA